MAEGLRAVRDRPWIAAVLLMAMSQLLLVIPACSVLLPVLVKSNGAATSSYGYVLALGAVGGLIGAVFAGHVRPRLPGLVANLMVMLFVLEPLMLLVNAPGWALVLGWFLSSLGLGPFLVYWETALQRDIPPELLARVISIDWMCSFALMPLGLALVGPAVSAFGRDTVLVVAVVAAILPPLLCLPVPGMLRFQTPSRVGLAGSPDGE
jgi:DHA3 family tetracycline resistance protein-like MFS transporter